MNAPKLPAGMVNDSVEIFTVEKQAKFIQGGIVRHIQLLPKEVHKALFEEMKANRRGLKVLRRWHPDNIAAQYIQHVKCNHGGFDNIADSDALGRHLTRESWNCGMRGTCEGYGKICKAVVSRRQMAVISQVKSGDPNKWISDRMGISENTLRAHIHRICSTLGLHGKLDLIRYAFENGL